eukprot:c42572_g1_i1 orf=26-193(+)
MIVCSHSSAGAILVFSPSFMSKLLLTMHYKEATNLKFNLNELGVLNWILNLGLRI